MVTGSFLTQNYSRSQSEIQGDLHNIRKAFLHISLHENDMSFLRFLWWEGGISEKAVIYRHRRVAEREGELTCQLIQARSKVTPLKGTSIPRLELFTRTIGARIADSVKKDLHMVNVDFTYWSDSMDALHWI
ncbi:uncharacterized protein TNCV_3253981 [Trichonephila clavipes]|nr:uncharacterized protein TNCV_3253981 [Trichonephila clavipes]